MDISVAEGYIFKPTDEDLINCYLLNKITGNPLPMEGFVTESDLYSESELLEIFRLAKDETHMYFFVQLKKKSVKGSRINRTVGKNGTWNSLDSGKLIFDDDEKVIGRKRSLDYTNKGSAEHGAWNMKEYSLNPDSLTSKGLKKDYVLCVLKKKKGRGTKRAREDNNEQLVEQQTLLNVYEDAAPPLMPEQSPCVQQTCYGWWNNQQIILDEEHNQPMEQPTSSSIVGAVTSNPSLLTNPQNEVITILGQQPVMMPDPLPLPLIWGSIMGENDLRFEEPSSIIQAHGPELTANIANLQSDIKAPDEHVDGKEIHRMNDWLKIFVKELKTGQELPLKENELVVLPEPPFSFYGYFGY